MREIFGKAVYDLVAEIVDPTHTALLMVDVTNDFYSPEGHFAGKDHDVSRLQDSLPALGNLLAEARHAGIPCIHIQNTVLPGGRSDSGPFMRFKQKAVDSLPVYTIEGTWGWEFVPGFEPRPGEVVVKKHRPSAFVSTDLEMILRVAGVKTVVLGGCVTEGCVQSTAVDAMYRDYYTVVVTDCVATYKQELHNASLKWLAPRVELVESPEVTSVWRELASRPDSGTDNNTQGGRR